MGSQRSFEACAHSRPWTSDLRIDRRIGNAAGQREFRTRFLAALQREFDESAECSTLLVSCEHFHSRLTTVEEIVRLRELLSPWVETFEIVLYIRRQDRVAVSWYSTRLKSGQTRIPVFFGSARGEVSRYFDYESLYVKWAEVFGERSLRLRIFDRRRFLNGDLLADFCAVCGILLEGKCLPGSANESLNQAGIDFLQHLNKEVPKFVNAKVNPMHTELTAIVSRSCRGKSPIAIRSDAQAFYALYAPGNERLRARVFPEDPAPLFDDDFSEYPETLAPHTPRYADAVRIATEIWKELRKSAQSRGAADDAGELKRQLAASRAENQCLKGQLAARGGNVGKARGHFLAALEIDEGSVAAHMGLAKLLLKEDTEEGWVHLEKARALSKKPSEELSRLYESYRRELKDMRAGDDLKLGQPAE